MSVVRKASFARWGSGRRKEAPTPVRHVSAASTDPLRMHASESTYPVNNRISTCENTIQIKPSP